MGESERPRGGTVYGGKAEIMDEVINRIGQYGDEYINALTKFNDNFPSTKYKKIERPEFVEMPKGVKVRSTVYPDR